MIIVTKFTFFLAEPDWSPWQTNWFINKLFVLACFVTLLGYLWVRRQDLRARRAETS